MKNDHKTYPTPKWIYIYAILGGISILATSLFFAWKVEGQFSHDAADWAQFGGYFGGVLGPGLAFFSFLALLHTIVLQSRELQLTREEMSSSREIADQQKKSIVLQRLENTFFQLLSLQYTIRDNLRFQGEAGLNAFSMLADTCDNHQIRNFTLKDRLAMLQSRIQQATDDNVIMQPEHQNLLFERSSLARDIVFLNGVPEKFRSYLASLTYLMSLIHTQNELRENSQMYFGIIKSQLTNLEELFLLRFSLEPDQDASQFLFYPIISRNEQDAQLKIREAQALKKEVRDAFNPSLYAYLL